MTEATHRQIRAATLIWMGFVAASRVAGLIREIVVARSAGATGMTDVFFAAFTLPDFINYLLAGGALSITFIPILTTFLVKGEEAEGWRVFSTVLNLIGLAAAVVLGAGMIWAEPLCRLFGRGFSPEQQQLLVRLTRILLPAQFAFFAAGLFGAAQMAKGRHLLPAAAPLVYNAGIIAGGLLLVPSLGVEGFCWGALAGALVGPGLLQVIGALRVGWSYRPRIDVKHPAVRQFFWLTLPVMVGQSILVTDDFLMRYFGAFLTPASISWLNYAKKLALVLPGVLGQSAAAATYPSLAAQAERGEYNALALTLRSGLRRGLLLGGLGAVLLLVLNREAAVLVFRGNRFTTSDALATGQALAILAVAVPAWVVQALLARGFYALRSTWPPTLIGTALTVAGVPLYGLLGQQGYLGLAVASSLSMVVYVVLLQHDLRRRLSRRQAGLPALFGAGWLLRSAGVVALTLLSAALARGGVGQLWPGHSIGEALLRAAGVGVVGVAVFTGLAGVLGVGEAAVLPGLLQRLWGRVRGRSHKLK